MSSVANRYSKALFQVALERKKIDTVLNDLQMIQSLIESSKEVQNLMLNPLIPEKKRNSLISRVFQDKVDSLTFDFLNLISDKKRTAFLKEIAEKYADRVMTHKGVIPGEIKSARKMSSAQREAIENKVESMTGKNIVFSEEIDQTLIGGFVVRVKDTVIDLSVKGQLEKLRHKLVHG